jgi:hypothetical protein
MISVELSFERVLSFCLKAGLVTVETRNTGGHHAWKR